VKTLRREKVPHPILVSESGRAISRIIGLIVEVLGAFGEGSHRQASRGERRHRRVRDPDAIRKRIGGSTRKRCAWPSCSRHYHATRSRSAARRPMFGLGYLPLEQKALVERLFWSACARSTRALRGTARTVPGGLDELEERLSEQYLCDFSVFQSMLDHWAIVRRSHHAIDRSMERPNARAVLVDLTCDSDGKVDHYVSSNADRRFIELHALEEASPTTGASFSWAPIRDIMGDITTCLAGSRSARVRATATSRGTTTGDEGDSGTAVQDMLALVQYFPNDLHRRMNEQIRQQIESGKLRAKVGHGDAGALHALLRGEHLLRSARRERRQYMKTGAAKRRIGFVQMSCYRGHDGQRREARWVWRAMQPGRQGGEIICPAGTVSVRAISASGGT
jgi:arginine decarboxylase